MIESERASGSEKEKGWGAKGRERRSMTIMQERDEWVTYFSLNNHHHSPHEQRNRDREREGERGR